MRITIFIFRTSSHVTSCVVNLALSTNWLRFIIWSNRNDNFVIMHHSQFCAGYPGDVSAKYLVSVSYLIKIISPSLEQVKIANSVFFKIFFSYYLSIFKKLMLNEEFLMSLDKWFNWWPFKLSMLICSIFFFIFSGTLSFICLATLNNNN